MNIYTYSLLCILIYQIQVVYTVINLWNSLVYLASQCVGPIVSWMMRTRRLITSFSPHFSLNIDGMVNALEPPSPGSAFKGNRSSSATSYDGDMEDMVSTHLNIFAYMCTYADVFILFLYRYILVEFSIGQEYYLCCLAQWNVMKCSSRTSTSNSCVYYINCSVHWHLHTSDD